MHRLLRTASIASVVLFGVPRRQVVYSGAGEMRSLTAGLRTIEAACEGNDAAVIEREARAARTICAKVEQWPAPEGRAQDHAAQARRLGALFAEMADLAEEGNVAGAAQVLPDLRATCVSCHTRFRGGNSERGDYPRTENVVHVRVDLRDIDEAPVEDRSWVLVFLEREDDDAEADPWLRKPPAMSQAGRQFQPRVLPVVVGTTVEFPNDDEVFHNVFSLSKTKSFDLGIYEPGRTRRVTFERPGLIKVHCNIHPDMAASIVVLNQPWFGLTDSAGEVVISGVPNGRWTLRAWNDHGGEARAPIELDGTPVDVTVQVTEARRSLQHKNKYGQPYKRTRSKY